MFTTEDASQIADNAAWTARVTAIEFAEQRIDDWRLSKQLPAEVATNWSAELRQLRIQTFSQAGNLLPPVDGFVPLTTSESDSIQTYRNWKFVQHQLG